MWLTQFRRYSANAGNRAMEYLNMFCEVFESRGVVLFLQTWVLWVQTVQTVQTLRTFYWLSVMSVFIMMILKAQWSIKTEAICTHNFIMAHFVCAKFCHIRLYSIELLIVVFLKYYKYISKIENAFKTSWYK